MDIFKRFLPKRSQFLKTNKKKHCHARSHSKFSNKKYAQCKFVQKPFSIYIRQKNVFQRLRGQELRRIQRTKEIKVESEK